MKTLSCKVDDELAEDATELAASKSTTVSLLLRGLLDAAVNPPRKAPPPPKKTPPPAWPHVFVPPAAYDGELEHYLLEARIWTLDQFQARQRFNDAGGHTAVLDDFDSEGVD